ncbi:hypothetical protein KKC94_00290 [Patescibacteria group bacterium]|nr:hypothetical protein [Patescibacteria group bacterium]
MLIIPAIFIQNGKAVSLYKGEDNPEKKTYHRLPEFYAKEFQEAGAKYLEVIDLDAKNRKLLPNIRAEFTGEIWWGGEVRTIEEISELLANGATRIILGTSASPIYKEALEKFGVEKIMAGLKVHSDPDAPDKCTELSDQGFKYIILHDLESQGTLFHPNFDVMEKCFIFSNAKIFASGGVADVRHIDLLKKAGVTGVIIARALYERHLDLKDLIQRFEDA